MDGGKLQLLTEADFVLSKCGRFQPPTGSVVYIPKAFLVQAVLPLAATQTFYKEITGDTTWCWRALSFALSGDPPLVSAQILKPDGHFLYNGLLDLTLQAGYGSSRYVLAHEIEVPPGSKIQLALSDQFLNAAAVQPVSLLCEGAYAYYLKGGRRSSCPEEDAADMPRVFGTVNQNLIAPFWATGLALKTPHGFEDAAFTYGNGTSNVSTMTIGGNTSGIASIQIANENDFQVRRFLFDVTSDAGVTAGTFLARIRLGSGYAFTDDYIDVARLLGSSYLAKGWDIRRGDQILFDLSLVDGAGTGNISIACYADGVKRRAK